MKINTDKAFYQALKKQFKQKLEISKQEAKEIIKDTAEYMEPKLKSSAETASDYVKENYPKAKKAVQELYAKAKQKLQPKVDDFMAYVNASLNPTQQEILSKEISRLQRKIDFKTGLLNNLKAKHPQETLIIAKYQKELKELETKRQIAINKYKEFTDKQSFAQESFDKLNNTK